MEEITLVRIRPVKVIAEILTLISFVWLTVSIAGPEWVDVKFQYQDDNTWNWGIWRTCNTIDGDETVCMEADWVTACLVFSIIALILSLVSAVCGVLGLLVAKTAQRKRKFYTVAGGLMAFVALLEFMVVIIFPVKFGDDIVMHSETVRRWDFDWTYGFAWGAFIFSVGAAVFFLFPDGSKPETTNDSSSTVEFSKDRTP